MHDPWEPHIHALQRTVRYLQGTLEYGLHLYKAPSRRLVAYTDAVWEKDTEMDIHFIRKKVARGEVRVLYVPSRFQIADIFTKGLSCLLFDDFRDNLRIRSPLAETAGVYWM
ncbi:uncharacterized protein [Rutidosis leptorrhynchoides]|uniref:uncharacterized protein n=1 Tax=Rutidosis leptorrhynchoides TaxID=125765 RepID=UPI003A999DBB